MAPFAPSLIDPASAQMAFILLRTLLQHFAYVRRPSGISLFSFGPLIGHAVDPRAPGRTYATYGQLLRLLLIFYNVIIISILSVNQVLINPFLLSLYPSVHHLVYMSADIASSFFRQHAKSAVLHFFFFLISR